MSDTIDGKHMEFPYPSVVPEPEPGKTGWEDPVPVRKTWALVISIDGDEVYFDIDALIAISKNSDGIVTLHLPDFKVSIEAKQYHGLITYLIDDQ